MFLQYNLLDNSPVSIQATTNKSVDQQILSTDGRGQIEAPDDTDITAVALDTMQTPPVLVQKVI